MGSLGRGTGPERGRQTAANVPSGVRVSGMMMDTINRSLKLQGKQTETQDSEETTVRQIGVMVREMN